MSNRWLISGMTALVVAVVACAPVVENDRAAVRRGGGAPIDSVTQAAADDPASEEPGGSQQGRRLWGGVRGDDEIIGAPTGSFAKYYGVGRMRRRVVLDRVDVSGTVLRAVAKIETAVERLRPEDFVGVEMLGIRAGEIADVPLRIVDMVMDDDVGADGKPMNRFAKPYPRGYSSNTADVTLYKVAFQNRAGAWVPLCGKQTITKDGKTLETTASERGVFVAGGWSSVDGQHPWGGPDSGTLPRVTYACADGAIAKCLRWGYKPWMSKVPAPDGGDADLGPLHGACVRAARADYCGDGKSYTFDGTLVDIFDRYGFVPRLTLTPAYRGFSTESAFSPWGATALERTRYVGLKIGGVTSAGLGRCDGEGVVIVPPPVDPDSLAELPVGHKTPVYRRYIRSLFPRGRRATPCPGDICVDSSTYCPHKIDVAGAKLSPDCNECTADICADSASPACCDDSWTAACATKGAACATRVAARLAWCATAGPDCNVCSTAVCADTPACCREDWTDDCSTKGDACLERIGDQRAWCAGAGPDCDVCKAEVCADSPACCRGGWTSSCEAKGDACVERVAARRACDQVREAECAVQRAANTCAPICDGLERCGCAATGGCDEASDTCRCDPTGACGDVGVGGVSCFGACDDPSQVCKAKTVAGKRVLSCVDVVSTDGGLPM